jgi:hypothetical protein
MSDRGIKEFLTWIPAFTFPLSHIVQIARMIQTGTVSGVSPWTFGGYFFGNLGAYIFAEKYSDIRTLLGFILTAILEVVIVTLWFYYMGMTGWAVVTVWSALFTAFLAYMFISTHEDDVKKWAEVAGFFPAIFFPAATAVQLWHIVRDKTIDGVSCAGWSLQILANLGAYFLVGKLTDIKNIGAFLGTAVLDVLIVYYYLQMGGDLWGCLPSMRTFGLRTR